MSMSRRGLAAVLLSFTLLLAAAGVSGAREKVEVWVGHDSWVPYLMRFNEIQDEYEVEFLIQGSTDALIAAVAAGTPPDVFRSGELLELAARGVIQPLDSYIERDGVNLGDFIPGIMRSLQWEGKTYGLPLNGDAQLVYYNIDRFEERGLDANSPPATWTELESAARLLTKTGGDGRLEQLGFTWWWRRELTSLFLYQNHVTAFNEDLTDIGFDNAQALAVIDWIVDSQNEINGGQAAVDALIGAHGDSTGAFVAGALAMDLREPYVIARMERDNPGMRYGVIPLPIPEGGKRVTLSGGHRVTIPTGAKNPEGAWAFIKWVTSYEAGMEFAEPGFSERYIGKNYQGIGQSMSARMDVNLAAPFYRETPYWRDFAREIEFAMEYPVHPLHQRVFIMLHDGVRRVLDQEMSPGEALAHAAREARAALSDWQ